MLANAIGRTLTQIVSPPFRAVLWKSVGLTIALFVALWFGLEFAVSTFLTPVLGPFAWGGWVTTALAWLLGAGIVVGAGFLLAPVTSVFAGLFLDDVADAVEREFYPDDPPGRPLPLGRSIAITARFLALVVGANLLALVLVLAVGLGVAVFFVVNGYLLGREYFQFAALRHRSYEEADALRRRHGGTVFLAGLAIAGILAVPVVNLLTPLFAAALMVHLHRALAARAAT